MSELCPEVALFEPYELIVTKPNPLGYPGVRPEASFVSDAQTISALHVGSDRGRLTYQVNGADGLYALDQYLAEHDAAPVAGRIPMLAYGANMAPRSLRFKYNKTQRPDMQVVPTVYAELRGADIVWSGGPGVLGNTIAALYDGPEVADTTVQVGINLLTPEQLLIMHATELSYELGSRAVSVAGQQMPVYVYSGQDPIYWEDAQPVAVAAVPARNRSLPVASAEGMMSKILSLPEVLSAIVEFGYDTRPESLSPQSYVDFIRSFADLPHLKASDQKLVLKRQVHAALEAVGLSRMPESRMALSGSWANPSTLRTLSDIESRCSPSDVYVLPSSELAIGDWKNREARRGVLYNIAEHTHRHFPQAPQDSNV